MLLTRCVMRDKAHSTDHIDPPVGDDAVLWRQLLVRDRAALTAVWNQYAPLVTRTLQRSLGAAEVDDQVQDAFLRFFAAVPRLREPDALRSFIIGVTINVAKGELRRRWLKRWLRLGSDDEPVANSLVEEVNEDARDALRRFYRVLDRLNAADRTAFVLRFIEEMELQEVAGALGISLATLKRRLPRIAARVQRAVDEDAMLSRFVSSESPWVKYVPRR